MNANGKHLMHQPDEKHEQCLTISPPHKHLISGLKEYTLTE